MIGPGDVAVVAGAGGAIGSVFVDRLLGRGATVIGVVRAPERVLRSRDRPGLEVCIADVTSSVVDETVRACVGERPVRMVVNLAKFPEDGALSRVAAERLAAAVDVKVGGLLRLVRACEPTLVDGARLVGFGGRLGLEPDAVAPCASIANAALMSLVRQLACEFGPRGVTAHVIAPGPVDGSDRSAGALAGISSRRELAARTPLGRLATPDEIVDATLGMLDAAGDLLNGGTLLLDGGRRSAIP